MLLWLQFLTTVILLSLLISALFDLKFLPRAPERPVGYKYLHGLSPLGLVFFRLIVTASMKWLLLN